MLTSEERIESLHARMNALREKNERQKAAALGTACGLLAVCLVMLICSEGSGSSGGTAGLYSGATMLLENAGGYVAIAVAAFMVGAVTTAVLLKRRPGSGNSGKESGPKDGTEE